MASECEPAGRDSRERGRHEDDIHNGNSLAGIDFDAILARHKVLATAPRYDGRAVKAEDGRNG